MTRSPFENAHFLADQIGSWLHNWKRADPTELVSYSDAPELRRISQGENLFRTRCSTCHTIGGGDTMEPDRNRVGPDLYGVTTRRERAWLEQWIAEPESMLAKKDPIIMELFFKYRMIAMPNMRLAPVEVDAILEYLATESLRLEALAPSAQPATSAAPSRAGSRGRFGSAAAMVLAVGLVLASGLFFRRATS